MCTWATEPGRRRWEAGDAKLGFYSQPALGNPLLLGGALEAPRGGRSRGRLVQAESVCIRPSGFHLHVGLSAASVSCVCVSAAPPGWQETLWCVSLGLGI